MSTIERRSLSLSMRCYRGLLRAYPQAFLAEFEDLLCQAFGDLAHRAVRSKGVLGLFVLWMRTVPDLISSALSQHFQTTSGWSFRLRWIAACTAGAAIAAILLFHSFFLFEIKLWLGLLPQNLAPDPRAVRVPLPVIRMNARFVWDAALLGVIAGFLQSLALGLKRLRRAAWMCATICGLVLAAGVLVLVPVVASYLRVRLLADPYQLLYYGGSAVLFISILGMLQTLTLPGRKLRSLAWIPASAVGLLACIPVARVSLLPLVGLAYGLVTALPLEWILRPRVSEDVVSVESSKLPS